MPGTKKGRKTAPPPRPPGAAPLQKVAYSMEEAAWSLGVSRAKLYRLVSEGRLPCVKIDGNTLIRPKDLEALTDNNLQVRGRRGQKIDPDNPSVDRIVAG